MLLLGPLVLREKVRAMDLVVFAGIAGGATLLLHASGGVAASSDPAKGNLAGILSGFAWAWTITGLRWTGKRDPHGNAATATVIVGNLIAFTVCLPMAIPVERASLSDTAVLLYLGIFQVALAYVFLTRSIRHVPGLEASTLLLVEPVFNPMWTWLFQGERPPDAVFGGGVMIVGAAFFGTWWQSRKDRKSI
jgi:drug/metabolite transporter (DMT)-like permease